MQFRNERFGTNVAGTARVLPRTNEHSGCMGSARCSDVSWPTHEPTVRPELVSVTGYDTAVDRHPEVAE